MIWFWLYFTGVCLLMIVSPPVNRHVVFDLLWPIFIPVGLVIMVLNTIGFWGYFSVVIILILLAVMDRIVRKKK